MKTMKKLASLLLALAMIFALATTAFAASITITPPTVGEGAVETGITYTAYKIFDATISGDSVAYTIDSSNPYYNTIAAATNYFKLTQVGDTTTYVVTKLDGYTETAANTFADTLKAVTGVTAAGTLEKQTDGKYKLSGMTNGYYLITSSVGSDLILDTIGDIEVNTKNTYPSQDKKVENKDDYVTADMGQTLTFTIDVTIPEDAIGAIVVHDKMTGLAYQSMTPIEGITASTTNDDGCSVEFTLSETYVGAQKGNKITITYTAKVTADVAENESWLVDSTYTSQHDKVKVYSTDIVIDKYKGGSETTKLSGAQFVLYKVEDDKNLYYSCDEQGVVTWKDNLGAATVVTTDDKGAAQFNNIADGTYYILETEAPAGYNKLTAPVEVKVSATTSTTAEGATTVIDVTKKIENNAGTELPSTGGMGTTLFYIVGGVLVAAAVVLLVTKQRMAN